MSGVPRRVLFVCAANARQSQMAEGWLRLLGGARFVARSAGLDPAPLDPLATRAMQEVEIDISAQRGKSVAIYVHERFDLVVTLCDGSEGRCPPIARSAALEHRAFEDPSWFEDFDGHPDLDEYRRIRDELRAFVEELIARDMGGRGPLPIGP